MDEQPKPFVAPCRNLPPGAPFEWLKNGWRDLRAAPGISLAWGGFCWFLSTAYVEEQKERQYYKRAFVSLCLRG